MEDEKKTKRQLIEELNELRHDNSKLQDSEEEIRKIRLNYEKFTKAFLHNSIPLTISTLNEGRLVDVSNAFLSLTGHKREDVIGRTSTEIGFITEEQRKSAIEELRRSGHIKNYEMKVRTKNGSVKDELFNSVIMVVNHEQCLLTMMTDITWRKQAEEALRASELKYHQLYQSMMDAFVSTDMEGHIMDYNKSYLDMLGYASEEITGLTYKDITPEKWHEMEDAIVEEQVHPNGYSDIYEKEYRRKDGTIFPIELRVKLLRDSAGNPISMWAIIRDITFRKQSVAALQASEEKYRLIVENTNDAIYIHDFEGNILDVNENACRIVGYNREELVGAKLAKIDIECRGPANNKRLMQEGHAVYERENIRKDGVTVPVEVSARVVNREGKGLIMSFVRDISERKRMEAKITEGLKHMEQAQQIAKLGSYEYNFENDSHSISEEARRILAFLPTDQLITYERFMNCVQPDDLEHLRQSHASAIAGGQPFDFYYRIVRPDGEIRQVHGQGDCTFSPDGKPLRLSGTIQDITDRKLVEEELARHRDRLEQLVEERTKELENKTITLEEVNIALKVLLRNREEDKKDMESRFVMNVKTLINPYLEKMKNSPLDARQLAYLNIIEAHANNITTPMIKQMHQFNFTPMEVEVALLIKGGKSTKEISKIIGIAYSSVNSHRINIRKKLGISKKGGNLQSQLQSLD